MRNSYRVWLCHQALLLRQHFFFLISYEKNLLDTQWTWIDNDGGVHAGKTKVKIETLIASIHVSFYILQEKVAKSEEKIGGQGCW